MRIVLFCHSLVSDWNHGNAHFLRGMLRAMRAAGHDTRVYEPADAWSVRELLRDAGPPGLDAFRNAYPDLESTHYDPQALDLDEALDGADLVLVHEWNAHPLVAAIGRRRAAGGRFVLLFHDTHPRSVSDTASMAAYDLEHYDGVLAFGDVIREQYVRRGWARQAWTWHEAADITRFHPPNDESRRGHDGDLVWIGNWGDDERSAEILQYLVEPVAQLQLRAAVYGVRYPQQGLDALAQAGIAYGGWLSNAAVPDVVAGFRATVHIPRRPYVEALPGIPTIRVFEMLACGVPLVSSWWDDREGLFRIGRDFLMVASPEAMRRALRDLVHDPALAAALAASGLETIRSRHTCAHRLDELMTIVASIREPYAAGARVS
jgi:spore maturation protein CgeB